MPPKKKVGLGPTFESGNINLYTQPKVKNPDGSVSTVRSMSFGEDDREILIPTVEHQGKGILSDKDAIAQYYRTKKHLGMFKTPEEATSHGRRLHEAYERGDYDVYPKGKLNPNFPELLKRFLKYGPTGVE